MTFRVYLRWPDNQTTHKTTTHSKPVAEVAFRELVADEVSLLQQGALGVSYTHDGKQVDYFALAEKRDPIARPGT